MSKPSLDRIEAAIDRLDSFVASLINLRTIPDSIHVSVLRKSLPLIAGELRRAMDGKPMDKNYKE
jgi:hypothetical protein